MEALGGRGGIRLQILDFGSRREWVVSVTHRPRFSPGEKIPGTHCTGGWVGTRAGLDTEATGEILSPLPGIEPRSPGRPVRSQTLYWLSYPAHHKVMHVPILITIRIMVLHQNCKTRQPCWTIWSEIPKPVSGCGRMNWIRNKSIRQELKMGSFNILKKPNEYQRTWFYKLEITNESRFPKLSY
jgi:hypothetical protein